MGAERERLAEPSDASGLTAWHEWGSYVAERAWGTVREDYSADGDAWVFFPHDHARSRVYRWGEDALAGICDRRQGMAMGLALWNGVDPFLKERPFGLANAEGNHGEDAKDYWWHLDAVPSSAWLSFRYHYPQAAFPYDDLVRVNAERGLDEPEFELVDTGVFDDKRFWVVDVDYAKAEVDDILMRIRVRNVGPDPATIHVLPHVWFRNTWSWGKTDTAPRPSLRWDTDAGAVRADHPSRLGTWLIHATDVVGSDEHHGAGTAQADTAQPGTAQPDTVQPGTAQPDNVQPGTARPDPPRWLFCENETNARRLWGPDAEMVTPYPKDGINDHVVAGADTVNPERTGTRAAAWWTATVPPGETREFRLRAACVAPASHPPAPLPLLSPDLAPADDHRPPIPARERPVDVPPDTGTDFEQVMATRLGEADEFYAELTPEVSTVEEARVMRQAFAGLLFSRQFYRYDVARWLTGDPAGPAPPRGRGSTRNGSWAHLAANDIISMPDTWEYPWFASWDLAFHCVALAHIDPGFAKQQLLLLTREWFQHPNGQIPAYEWDFGDANPPVHAWAAMRVFEIDGCTDFRFLERIFHKLVINFTWWVNRQDAEGNNVFEGGFLGLDNIGPFNRSKPLPGGSTLEQSDGTAWMAMYCLNLLEIAIALAANDSSYEDMAVKFLEHFTLVAAALSEAGLWDDEDEFFYDVIRTPDGATQRIKVRSMVGLIPLAALTVVETGKIVELEDFRVRAQWFLSHRHDMDKPIRRFVHARHDPGESTAMGSVIAGSAATPGQSPSHAVMLSVVDPGRLRRVLRPMLDTEEFLSPHGLRSLSKWHTDHPVTVAFGGESSTVSYQPAESTSRLFGGNSNWRGPVWFPLNFLLIESLLRAHRFLGNSFVVQLPHGSGHDANLAEVADELAERLIGVFRSRPEPDPDGTRRRPAVATGGLARFEDDPLWNELPVFFEYFHGDNGTGLGAAHQTGWTAIVADLLISRPIRRALAGS